jgi:hypothetical protein
LKFKEIISSKTQSKLRKLCQLIRNINSSLLPPNMSKHDIGNEFHYLFLCMHPDILI